MAPEVTHPRVPCPFRPCTARPEVLRTRGLSLSQPMEDLIRQHQVEPASWFGICPASGQGYPVSPRVAGLLDKQADMLDRMQAERQRTAVPKPQTPQEMQAAKIRAARQRGSAVDDKPKWFRKQS